MFRGFNSRENLLTSDRFLIRMKKIRHFAQLKMLASCLFERATYEQWEAASN